MEIIRFIAEIIIYIGCFMLTVGIYRFLYYVPKYLKELVYIISHVLGIEIIYEDDENDKNN